MPPKRKRTSISGGIESISLVVKKGNNFDDNWEETFKVDSSSTVGECLALLSSAIREKKKFRAAAASKVRTGAPSPKNGDAEVDKLLRQLDGFLHSDSGRHLAARVGRDFSIDEIHAVALVVEYIKFLKLKVSAGDWCEQLDGTSHASSSSASTAVASASVAQATPLQLTPPVEIDKVWKHHIFDTRRYGQDCENLFGRVLHHDPDGPSAPETTDVKLVRARRTVSAYVNMFGGVPPQRSLWAFTPDVGDVWASTSSGGSSASSSLAVAASGSQLPKSSSTILSPSTSPSAASSDEESPPPAASDSTRALHTANLFLIKEGGSWEPLDRSKKLSASGLRDGDTVRLLTRSSDGKMMFLARIGGGQPSVIELPETAHGANLVAAICNAKSLTGTQIVNLRHKSRVLKHSHSLAQFVSKQPVLIDVELRSTGDDSNGDTTLLINVRVTFRATLGIIPIKIKRTTAMEMVFMAIATKVGEAVTSLYFTSADDGRRLASTDTAASLGLTEGRIIDCFRENPPAPCGDRDDVKIVIKVRLPTFDVMTVEVKRSGNFQKLLEAVAQKLGVDVRTIMFLFDGDKVYSWMTPNQLGMKDGDQVDCLKQQLGC